MWDLSKTRDQDACSILVETVDPIVTHAAPPCTKLCAMALNPGQKGFDKKSYDTACGVIKFAVDLLQDRTRKNAAGSLESPKGAKTWGLKRVQDFFGTISCPKPGRYFADPDGCAYGFADTDGTPFRKSLMLAATYPEIQGVDDKCSRDHEHRVIRGRTTNNVSRAQLFESTGLDFGPPQDAPRCCCMCGANTRKRCGNRNWQHYTCYRRLAVRKPGWKRVTCACCDDDPNPQQGCERMNLSNHCDNEPEKETVHRIDQNARYGHKAEVVGQAHNPGPTSQPWNGRRMVVDYRQLNKVTVPVREFPPRLAYAANRSLESCLLAALFGDGSDNGSDDTTEADSDSDGSNICKFTLPRRTPAPGRYCTIRGMPAPVPFVYCRFCCDSPSYHHGRCCPWAPRPYPRNRRGGRRMVRVRETRYSYYRCHERACYRVAFMICYLCERWTCLAHIVRDEGPVWLGDRYAVCQCCEYSESGRTQQLELRKSAEALKCPGCEMELTPFNILQCSYCLTYYCSTYCVYVEDVVEQRRICFSCAGVGQEYDVAAYSEQQQLLQSAQQLEQQLQPQQPLQSAQQLEQQHQTQQQLQSEQQRGQQHQTR